MGGFYLVRSLQRLDRGCGHRVPIPASNPSYIVARQTETGTGALEIPFACPECGLVSLYSGLNAHLSRVDTPCPYLADILALAYTEARCVDSNCEVRTKIHVVLDGTTRRPVCAKPPSEWEIDLAVKCACGRPLKSPLPDYQPYFVAQMPF